MHNVTRAGMLEGYSRQRIEIRNKGMMSTQVIIGCARYTIERLWAVIKDLLNNCRIVFLTHKVGCSLNMVWHKM